MRLRNILETTGTIETISHRGSKKYRYIYNTTPIAFARNVKMAIMSKEVIAGIYDINEDDIILWRRDEMSHGQVIKELGISRDKLISFYISPKGGSDDDNDRTDLNSNEWMLGISQFSTKKEFHHTALDTLNNNNIIIKAIELANNMGFMYYADGALMN